MKNSLSSLLIMSETNWEKERLAVEVDNSCSDGREAGSELSRFVYPVVKTGALFLCPPANDVSL